MENNQIVENSCGLRPLGTEDIIIGNDPNFVFINDIDFDTVILYDIEGNIINVNSWIECAHYVRGGWSSNSSLSNMNEEFIFFLCLVGLSTISYFLLTFFKKRKLYVKN